MLDKIKQWTCRLLERSVSSKRVEGAEDTCKSALRRIRAQRVPLDPRELPRPARHHCHCHWTGDESVGMSSCCCPNCIHLSNLLLECAICLEPLGKGVTSCVECGNVACCMCALRLPRCPFCRKDQGLMPNLALNRLICKLDIPCHNSVIPVRCPHKKCEWRGDIESVSSHLEQVHLVTILNGSSVTLDIAEFQRKAEQSETRPRHYSVLLSCFSDVFVCLVVLHQCKLKVALSQLAYMRQRRLAAWVEVCCTSKTTKGIIPLSKNKSEFEVPTTNFVSPTTSCGNSDRVSISISIRVLS